jgi:hypothetical protein
MVDADVDGIGAVTPLRRILKPRLHRPSISQPERDVPPAALETKKALALSSSRGLSFPQRVLHYGSGIWLTDTAAAVQKASTMTTESRTIPVMVAS